MAKTPEESSNFEGALSQLEALVQKIETGKLSLEESLQLFEQGVTISKVCQQKLTEAEQRIKVLTADDELVELDDE